MLGTVQAWIQIINKDSFCLCMPRWWFLDVNTFQQGSYRLFNRLACLFRKYWILTRVSPVCSCVLLTYFVSLREKLRNYKHTNQFCPKFSKYYDFANYIMAISSLPSSSYKQVANAEDILHSGLWTLGLTYGPLWINHMCISNLHVTY